MVPDEGKKKKKNTCRAVPELLTLPMLTPFQCLTIYHCVHSLMEIWTSEPSWARALCKNCLAESLPKGGEAEKNTTAI